MESQNLTSVKEEDAGLDIFFFFTAAGHSTSSFRGRDMNWNITLMTAVSDRSLNMIHGLLRACLPVSLMHAGENFQPHQRLSETEHPMKTMLWQSAHSAAFLPHLFYRHQLSMSCVSS